MDGGGLFFILFVGGVIIASSLWRSNRSQIILERWAACYGYRILQVNSQFLHGPFFWTTSRGQIVYRVLIEDETGRRRAGWVRCGSYWTGLISDDIQVRWDDAQ